jgi:carboxymethylenebutenolidase
MDVDLSGPAKRLGGSPRLSGYLARPTGAGPWPGVVVLHEAFGIDDVMRRQADRLAAAGYLTLMPDLFSEGGAKRCLIATMRAVAAGEGRVFHDVEVARRWLLDRNECTGAVGAVGFCLGGGLALLVAARGFGAVAPNYGMLPKDLPAALAGAYPVVASYAGRDRGLRGAAVRLEVALERAGIAHDVKEYPDAGHAFMDDRMPGPRSVRPLLRVMGMGPDPVAAADAWRRIEAFFAEHLGRGGAEPKGPGTKTG